MLVKESQLRAIIREELIREHQELLVENFLQDLGKKGSKLLPALTLVLSANLLTACDGIKDMFGGSTKAEISSQQSEKALGLVAQDFGENVDVSVVGIQNAQEMYKQIDSSIRRAEATLKYLDNRKFKDPKDREVWKKQVKRSKIALEKLKEEIEKNRGFTFSGEELEAQRELLETNKGIIVRLKELLGWKNFDGSPTVK